LNNSTLTLTLSKLHWTDERRGLDGPKPSSILYKLSP
jgi:hypothetical protein